MAKEKQNVEPYWGEKLLESFALATAATAAERRMIMNKTDKLRSVFRTFELTLITMLALDVKNLLFWIVWGIALILDACIDVSARK